MNVTVGLAAITRPAGRGQEAHPRPETSRRTGVGFNPDGSVVVSSLSASTGLRIFVVSPTGQLAVRYGRRGEGPGRLVDARTRAEAYAATVADADVEVLFSGGIPGRGPRR